MALFSQNLTNEDEGSDPLSNMETEDAGTPAAGTFFDEEADSPSASPLDAIAREEYKAARDAYSKSTSSVLDQIRKARDLLLSQPTAKSRSEYVQGLAQKLSAPKSPDDPRFFERQNLRTFLRDVGQYGAEQRQSEKEAKFRQQQELQKLDELAARYGEETGYKRLQLATQLMGRTRPASSAGPDLTADERNARAMGLPLKDYLEYRNKLIADRSPPPAPPKLTPEEAKASLRNQAIDTLNDPNASAADKQKAQATIDSLTPADVRKTEQAKKTWAASYLDRTKNQQTFTLPDLESAIKQIDEGGQFVAGNLSNWLVGLPWIGQPATDLERTLDSLRSNLGFSKLEQLKDMSPYGASGLGAVSNAEQKLLQSVKGSIERDQSPASLKKNLERIRDFYKDQQLDLLNAVGIEDIDAELQKLSNQAGPGVASSEPPAAAPRIDLDAIRRERERREKAKRESGGT